MRPMTQDGRHISASVLNIVFVAFILATTSCNHQPVSATLPSSPPPAGGNTSQPTAKLAMQADQVNIAGWDKAWTNLINDVEQSFRPELAKLRAVEVELVVGNPGPPDDELTLTIFDAQGHQLAVVAQTVSTDNPDSITFNMPADGMALDPGQLYRMRLSGGPTFGWKYIVGGYPHGEATFNGKPLLAQARATFLFRTFGAP